MSLTRDAAAIGFITESNRIEGIHREPTGAELNEFHRFMGLSIVTVADLEHFVEIYQPDARLRDAKGLDVRVGNYTPPPGSYRIHRYLKELLREAKRTSRDAYRTHLLYEQLHPFTDGNGRSGRMLWAWQMTAISPLGFLHHFYYQTLQANEQRP